MSFQLNVDLSIKSVWEYYKTVKCSLNW